MLKHEDNPQTSAPSPSQPASEVRVTPEELAAAITRLEARKDTHQHQADSTVAIGDVVEQLGLDATPEEILLEVESGRRSASLQRGTRMSVKQRLGLILTGGLLAASLVVIRMVPEFAGGPTPRSDALIVVASPPYAPEPQRILVNPDLLVGDASGKLVLLSEVGDNQPVHCTYNIGGFKQYSPDSPSATWTLVKHDGRLYARGWMPKMSPKVLQSEGADVSAVKRARFIVPITLPLKGLSASVSGGASSDAEFHAQNIHLDKHAYEKW